MKHDLASPFYIQHLVNQIIKPHSVEDMNFFWHVDCQIYLFFSILGALHFLKSYFVYGAHPTLEPTTSHYVQLECKSCISHGVFYHCLLWHVQPKRMWLTMCPNNLFRSYIQPSSFWIGAKQGYKI
jgi:hypothetical protein